MELRNTEEANIPEQGFDNLRARSRVWRVTAPLT